MVFTVLAAVDFHQKCNFEFTFPATPTISELREKLEVTLGTEAALRRPAGMPVTPFSIHRIQVFDERMEMWVDLVSSSQLQDYCQIYVFQRESPWHKDTPGRIPPPVRPSQPLQQYSPHTFGQSPQSPLPLPGAGLPLQVGAGLDSGLSLGVRQPAYQPPYHPVPISPPVAESLPQQTSVRLSPPRAHPEPALSAYSAGIGASATPMGVAFADPLSMVPEVTTHGEKVRLVFEELDQRKGRSISYDDWQTVFTRLRLLQPDGPFSEETCHDLFHKKADKNEDGFVSFSEFQLFAEMYPKMLDSLYFRCRDQVHHDSRRQNMESARNLQGELERRKDEAQEELADAEAAVAEAQQKEAESQGAVDNAKELEKDARQQKDEAHAATEEVRGRLRDAQGERDRVKEGMRQKDSALRSAQRGVDAAVKKEKNQEAELDKARKELERLQKLVEAQQREVERQEQLVLDAGNAIEQANAKVQDQEQARTQADEEMQRAQASVQAVEDELKVSLDHETELAHAHRDAVKEVNQAQAHRTHEDQEMSKAKTKEVQKKAGLERATRALEDHDKVVDALEAKDKELEERRAAEEARENELLEQEVRLREQRECMEKKEEALRTAHQDFTNESGRASPLRVRLTGPYTSNLSA